MSQTPKIFFIGLNKTGTTSLHQLALDSGYKAIHWRDPDKDIYLAKRVFSNFSIGLPLLSGIDGYDVYSEFSYISDGTYLEGSRFFKQLAADYPDAYFILNSRETGPWIRSRQVQYSVGIGSFWERFQFAFRSDAGEVVELWKQHQTEHHDAVRQFFNNSPHKFMEFRLGQDDINEICTFVAPDYTFDPSLWQQLNTSAQFQKPKPTRLASFLQRFS